MTENVNVEETQMQDGGRDTDTLEQPVEQEQSAPTEQPTEQDTFPREYVEKLRKEAAGHRDRAKRTDELAHRLHTALVEATGRLADARDLPYDEAHLEDPQALSQAIEALLADRPHLGSRKPVGNIGQGVIPSGDDVNLAGILRAGAM